MTWKALQVSAVALHETGKTRQARTVAEAALAAAASEDERAESRLTLAWVHHQLGNSDSSAHFIEQVHDARAGCLNGLLLCHDGKHAAALPVLEAASVDPSLDLRWRANALVGVGISAAYLGHFSRADQALDDAYELYTGLGELERAATCRHNQGFVAAEAGDLPRALALYDSADIDPTSRPEVLVDRAKALMGSGLLQEAGVALSRAGRLLGAAGRGPAYNEAMLAYSSCCLRAGKAEAALTAAQSVDSHEGRALAAHARIALGEQVDVNGVAMNCDPIVAARLRLAADQASLVAAQRSSTVPALRALGWLAQARLARTNAAALVACRNGLRADPRSVELAAAGRAAATHPRTVFTWVERERATLDGLGQVPTPAEMVNALGSTTLLSFYNHNGCTSAVSVIDGRFRLHDLGQVDPTAVRASMTLLATTGHGEDAANRALDELDQQIFSKIDIPRQPLLILTRELHWIPWGAFPTLRGLPVVTAPSALHWLRAEGDVPPGHLWVAGPRLEHAEFEVVELHQEHGGTLLVGADATVDAVLTAMADVGTVHIAAHCAHRPGAPLFSSLELADGPLYGHHIARIPRLPARVVLSACESALDLPRVFLDHGARSVVASTLPVVDARAAALVRSLHRELAEGSETGVALARHPGLGFVAIGR
ncbi:CHAT domain-containing protein [Actinokineospora diospyrosa]|uniref:CHAT domain-containing protein n=1 Tax=Actinokineospora diospyrosa TaxID=103728 RepID=UPI0031CEE06F